jgi:hypothetical protein
MQNSKTIYKMAKYNLIIVLFIFITGCGYLPEQGKIEAQREQQIVDDYYRDSIYYKPPFKLTEVNYNLSPYTGMTRDEWIKCGIYILEGAFQYVDSLEAPMYLPKFPGKSYPYEGNADAPQDRKSAAIFEAIARTFNVAAPILNINPDLEINGIKLVDYYKYHLLELLTNPECDYYIGSPKETPFQPTCELGNLSLWNMLTPDVFWNRLNKEEQLKVADMVYNWATATTCGHNWRYFNVMMLTFLENNNLKSDTILMLSHMDNLLSHYVGDGWYRDHSYDYYTIHVFHLYNAIWAEKYGNEHAPGRVKVIRKHQEEFYKTYPSIFGKGGKVNMYGRSILYRLGASAALPAAFFTEGNDYISPGEARYLASGSLIQFVTHPEFFNQGIPSLGFYGPFDACIQKYSCSASPYWMFMGFSALTLPETHPFWTAKEDMGHWSGIQKDEVTSKYSSGMGMLISNFGTGSTEYRPGKVHNQDPNYCKMVYNTHFPWEASREDGITSAELALFMEGYDEKAAIPMHADAAGYHDGVLYRQAAFEYKVTNIPCFIDMATIIVPKGEIRVERFRKINKSKLYLGHLSMPHINGVSPTITEKEIDGKKSVIVSIDGRQLAITNYMGWKDIDTLNNTGLHPESDKSTLLYAKYEDLTAQFGPVEILISTLLHKADNSEWTDEQLQPIASVEPLIKGVSMPLGGLVITLKSGQKYTVDFSTIDGMSSRD